MSNLDSIYREAAAATGKSEAQLRAMAGVVFASMLLHALKTPGKIVVTMLQIRDGRLELEVDLPPRRKTADSLANPPNITYLTDLEWEERKAADMPFGEHTDGMMRTLGYEKISRRTTAGVRK